MKQSIIIIIPVILIISFSLSFAEINMTIGVQTEGDINANIGMWGAGETNVAIYSPNINNYYSYVGNSTNVFVNGESMCTTSQIVSYVNANDARGPSRENVLSYITEGLGADVEDMDREQYEYANALSNFMYGIYTENIKPDIDTLYAYTLSQEESLNYFFEKFMEDDLANMEDLKCIGRVRYMYKYNIPSVECNGFVYSNTGGVTKGMGFKITQINDTPESEKKPEYTEVDQTKLLAKYDTYCEGAKRVGSVQNQKKYCDTECNGGKSNQCVCRNGVKILKWIPEKEGSDVKYASYSCIYAAYGGGGSASPNQEGA